MSWGDGAYDPHDGCREALSKRDELIASLQDRVERTARAWNAVRDAGLLGVADLVGRPEWDTLDRAIRGVS